VFNGHDHDEDGIKTKNNIPFIFDAHFGVAGVLNTVDTV
jgi:hypothetical protein